jgi:nucleotide-binding universal stress UspA family protein
MRAYKRILVPTDGTTLSLRAAKEAAALARDLKAKLTVIYVMAPFIPPMMLESVPLPAEAFDERAYRKAVEGHGEEGARQGERRVRRRRKSTATPSPSPTTTPGRES